MASPATSSVPCLSAGLRGLKEGFPGQAQALEVLSLPRGSLPGLNPVVGFYSTTFLPGVG